MGEMRNFEAEALAAVRRAGSDISRVFGHHDTSAAPAAATATMTTSTPGGPVPSFFADIKAKAHNFVDDLEQIDENAIGAVEAIKVNPTGVSIVNTVASIAHLPDPQGLLSGADTLLKTLAAALAAAAAATATATDGTQAVSGPQVAGQA